jgi:hypothetical protein
LLEDTTDGALSRSVLFSGAARPISVTVRPPLADVDFVLPESLGASASFASLVAETFPQPGSKQGYYHFLVGVTERQGTTWRWAYLPNLSPS